MQDELQVETARFALATFLDINLRTNIRTIDRIDVKKETADVNVALDIALKRRPDYLAQLDVVEQGRLGIVVAENQRLWDLSLIGGASLGRQAQIGTGLTPISPKVVSASIGLALIAPLNDLRPEQNAIHAGTTLRDAEIQLSVIKTGVEQQVRFGGPRTGFGLATGGSGATGRSALAERGRCGEVEAERRKIVDFSGSGT